MSWARSVYAELAPWQQHYHVSAALSPGAAPDDVMCSQQQLPKTSSIKRQSSAMQISVSFLQLTATPVAQSFAAA
jgi:hypothetical protein